MPVRRAQRSDAPTKVATRTTNPVAMTGLPTPPLELPVPVAVGELDAIDIVPVPDMGMDMEDMAGLDAVDAGELAVDDPPMGAVDWPLISA